MAVMNPLGSRNIIIIDDNYIGEYSQAYMEVGKQIDDIIIKYIGILKGIIDDGSMKGLTAEKLYSFADTASMLLFKTAGVLCDNNKSNMQKFIHLILMFNKHLLWSYLLLSKHLSILSQTLTAPILSCNSILAVSRIYGINSKVYTLLPFFKSSSGTQQKSRSILSLSSSSYP